MAGKKAFHIPQESVIKDALLEISAVVIVAVSMHDSNVCRRQRGPDGPDGAG
jgi:hypothetical protein